MDFDTLDRFVKHDDVKTRDEYWHVDPRARFNARTRVRVVKRNPSTIDVEDTTSGRKLRTYSSNLRKIFADDAPEDRSAVAQLVPYVALPHRATVVTWKSHVRVGKGVRHGDLLVVAGEGRGANTVRLEFLGGHPSGMYFRGVPMSQLDVVPLDELAARLPAYLAHREVS